MFMFGVYGGLICNVRFFLKVEFMVFLIFLLNISFFKYCLRIILWGRVKDKFFLMFDIYKYFSFIFSW